MTCKLCLFTIAAIALSMVLVPLASAQSGEPLKTVVPVNLDIHSGNITVGSTVYPGGNPGLHVLALVRQPDTEHLDAPDVIGDHIFTDAASTNGFLQSTLSNHPDALLLINGLGNYGFGPEAISANLNSFGAFYDLGTIGAPVPFVFIGVGGTNSGQAHQVGYSSHNVTGYLAKDPNGNYTFIQPDYVRFDLTIDGKVKIGSRVYQNLNSSHFGKCPSNSGFHLVVVQRGDPGANVADDNYCTADSNGEIQRFAGDLNWVNRTEYNLCFVVSFGHPIPSNWNFGTDGDARLYPVGQAIATLGGYWETIVYMTPTDTFSLVGTHPPPSGIQSPHKRARESSSVYPDHPSGELHGVMGRGRGDWYSPISSDPVGKANLDFYNILGQNPVPFPHPANQQELMAYQYIGQQLYQKDGGSCASPCNLRSSYGDLDKSISTWLSNLGGMKDAQGNDCSDSKNNALPFCVMKAQLETEFAEVKNIRALNNNLNILWAGSGTNIVLELESVYHNVSANLPQPPPQSPVPGLISTFTNFFLSIGSLVPEVGPILGAADAVFNFATGLTTDPSGNHVTSLNSTVATLEQQAAQQFNAQVVARGTQFDLIYQDWGKISALGGALENAQPGSGWYWDNRHSWPDIDGDATFASASHL